MIKDKFVFLPGCITYGENIEEAIEMAKEAIELYREFKEHEKFLLKIFGWKQTLREKYGIINKK